MTQFEIFRRRMRHPGASSVAWAVSTAAHRGREFPETMVSPNPPETSHFAAKEYPKAEDAAGPG